MEKKPFYITVPIFYPNAELHLGHAYVVTIADIMARYHRLIGDNTFFLTGSDENTSKVIKAAEALGKDPKNHLDEIVKGFQGLFRDLESSHDQFIRTSDEIIHWPGAIEVWNRLVSSGDIEKRKYSGLYCAACEAFYTEKDLVDGKCPYHYTVPVFIEEENYFFLLSRYTEKVKSVIESGELEIIPATRKNEILSLLGSGLQDVSFSRPKASIPWGIPVPGDDSQVMYVWCDALTSYITSLGFGRSDDEKYKTFWEQGKSVHVIGKDILRFHAGIWPAMLMSAGLPLPKKLVVHGMILSQGKKMSKSLGNVIPPKQLTDEYGVEALRLFFAKETSLFEDAELNLESFKAAYNANLANGLGNLVSRVMKMAETHLDASIEVAPMTIPDDWKEALDNFDIQKAANITWKWVQNLDQKIQETQPFKLVKTDKEAGVKIIKELVQDLYTVGRMLYPLMPETNIKIKELVKANKSPETPLFVRKD